jgi:hypothetical protein
MNGQELHGLVVHLRRRSVQSSLFCCGGFQPGEEGEDIYPLGGVQKSDGGVVKGVQIPPCLMDTHPGTGSYFDVQQHGSFDFSEQRGEVITHEATQLPQLSREPLEPVQAVTADHTPVC